MLVAMQYRGGDKALRLSPQKNAPTSVRSCQTTGAARGGPQLLAYAARLRRTSVRLAAILPYLVSHAQRA
jgi:hypothetical protein